MGGIGAMMAAVLDRRAVGRWTRAARAAPRAELGSLRRDLDRAALLRHRLDELAAAAEARLALPRVGSQAFPRPPGTDWAWRPLLWRGPLAGRGLAGVESGTRLGEEATVFHDAAEAEVTLRQVRNARPEDLAPFGLRLDVLAFDGTYLALAIDLPPAACAGLRRRHLVRLDVAMAAESPLDAFARLNIQHGPNHETLLRELPVGTGDLAVEFDLGYSKLNEKRVEKMWLDLIVEGPAMNMVWLRDARLSRHPRAEL